VNFHILCQSHLGFRDVLRVCIFHVAHSPSNLRAFQHVDAVYRKLCLFSFNSVTKALSFLPKNKFEMKSRPVQSNLVHPFVINAQSQGRLNLIVPELGCRTQNALTTQQTCDAPRKDFNPSYFASQPAQ
jgi:hypothetical protein